MLGGDLLRTLLDRSDNIIGVIDCDTGTIVDCNETVWRNAGLSRQEFVGKLIFERRVSFPLQTPEQLQALVVRLSEAKTLAIDTDLGRSDGSTYQARFTLSLQELSGVTYLLCIGIALPTIAPLQSKLEREATWQSALFRMASHPATATGELDKALQFITATAQQALPAHRCAVWRLDRDGFYFEQNYLREKTKDFSPVSHEEYPWLQEAVESGRACDLFDFCKNDEQRVKTASLFLKVGQRAALAAPIIVGGKVWGALTFLSERDRKWQADEIGFSAEVADQVAHVVLNQKHQVVLCKLIASQERLQAFNDISADLVYRIEYTSPLPVSLTPDEQFDWHLEKGRIADCNDALLRFVEQPAKTVIGMPLRTFMAPFPEQCRPEFLDLVKHDYREDDQEMNFIVNGISKPLLRNVVGVVEDGYLVSLWVSARDITGLRKAQELLRLSERRYQSFIENSSEGIFLIEYPKPISVDQQPDAIVKEMWETGYIGECNLVLAKMRGYREPSEMVGRHTQEFRQGTAEEWAQEIVFIRSGFRIAGEERNVRITKDGTSRWFSYSATGIVEDGRLLRIWGTVSDVTARKLLEADLRALSAHRVEILEQERTRIAREIHDELGQQLTALKFDAAACERSKRRPDTGELTKSIDAAIQTVRRIATDLRPAILDHFGLSAAVEWQASELARRTGMLCQCDLDENLNLNQDLATNAFRIVQEALTNAARHSGATRIDIRLRRNHGRLELSVKDDGKGIQANEETKGRPSLGLIGMRERAKDMGGMLTVTTTIGFGTQLEAWFPLPNRDAVEEVAQ